MSGQERKDILVAVDALIAAEDIPNRETKPVRAASQQKEIEEQFFVFTQSRPHLGADDRLKVE